MGVTTQYGLQAAFTRARQNIYEANLPNGEANSSAAEIAYAKKEAQNAVLSQSYLRLEQPLVINQSTFTFPILQTSSGSVQRPTEVRLDQQDAFFATSCKIYLLPGGGTATAPLSNMVPLTYPNAVTVPTGAAQLYSLYNGFLKITINKSVIVPSYPMLNFMQIPQTQLTGAATPPATQFDPAQCALFEPTINFIGTKTSLIQVFLGAAMSAIDANLYLGIIFEGVLGQNVTIMS